MHAKSGKLRGTASGNRSFGSGKGRGRPKILGFQLGEKMERFNIILFEWKPKRGYRYKKEMRRRAQNVTKKKERVGKESAVEIRKKRATELGRT